MNRIFSLFLISFLFMFLGCKQEQTKEGTEQLNPEVQVAQKPLSPKTNAMGNVGDTHIHIDYSAPSVRGRIIWGGLIAYDQVWAPGAHMAASVNFNTDVKINGEMVPAGTYGYFTIPGKEEWVVILNENYNQHRSDDYDEALDVLRLKVVPEQLSGLVETLTYEVIPAEGNKGSLSLMWEYKKIALEIEAL